MINFLKKIDRQIVVLFGSYFTANKITVGRTIVFGLIIPLWFVGDFYTKWLTIIIWSFCFYLDHVDGAVARQQRKETDTGKWIDPLSDKLIIFGGLLIFWPQLSQLDWYAYFSLLLME